MAISRNEAATALADIDAATRRSGTFRGYRLGGPILMLWAVVWSLGYAGMGLLPVRQWGWAWLLLDAAGVVGSILLAWRARPAAAPRVAGLNWRMLAGAVAGAAFIAVTFAMFRPRDPAPYLAFPGLFIGLVYVVVGLFGAARYLLVGGAMFALTLTGFFLFPPWLPFWMAAAGLALFASGVWMWKR